MPPIALKTTALAVASAVSVAACSNMSPGENGAVFGAAGGTAAGLLARAAGMSTGESIATGVAAGALIGAAAYIIAKHEATEHQRQVAEERARLAYERLRAERQRAARTATRKPAKKIPRYLAVDTVRNEHTSPRAKKSVMIWDTQAEQVVGKNVYDVQRPPPVGSTAHFDTYSAEYVGSGS